MTTPSSPNPFAAPTSGAAAVTPEAISGELAGRGARLASAVIDSLLLVVLAVGAVVLGTTLFNFDTEGAMAEVLIAVVALGLFLVINGWFLHSRGQTIGKMIMKVRITRIDGQRTTGMDTIVKRVFPTGLLSMIPVVGSIFSLVDVLFIFRQDRRCLHDLIAGTEVVRA